ncbi:Zinc finger transcription factor ace1 [Paramyrothecium foliicola]|nr:Zinc finger transcription factor ace1 [Paramyrothecium foliicola]
MSCSNPRRRTPVTRPGTDTDKVSAHKNNMTLRKGATFHSPTSPASSSSDIFVPPRLTRSQTHMDDVVDANRRRIALTLSDIEQAFSNKEMSPASPKVHGSPTLRDNSLPVPRGFLDLPVVDPKMAKQQAERRVLRPRSVRRNRHSHASDSGLGSSIASTNEKDLATSNSKSQTSASAITRSAVSSAAAALPSLSQKAINRIHEHTVRPLLEDSNLKDFHPIVRDVPRRIQDKEIICLRDLEKTLLFMAPVSQLRSDNGIWGETHRLLCVKEKSKTAELYLEFCKTSIRCIQATVEYLSEREQVRPGDRPYTSGYFIDLVQQIEQYGKQLAAARENDGVADGLDVELYVSCFVPLHFLTDKPSRGDEVKLYGGISENGRPAELIRVRKDGTAVSMATGKPVDLEENAVKIKRSLSEQREDEEEIMRSMARRKKNASPEELAPKKCREPGCNKEFKRPCDLTKHEKTHSRPWKCPLPTCKYHEFGWPTEKEMDRHVNDKHSDSPAMYECKFKPCPYKSKRESNCKQHMEKAHGWTYVRTKTNGKKLTDNTPSSAEQTPPLGVVSTPSETPVSADIPTPPQDATFQTFPNEFPVYQSHNDWYATNGHGLELDAPEAMDITLDNTSPSSAASYDQYPPYQNGSTFILADEDLYAAHVQIPAQYPTPEELLGKMMPQQMQMYTAQIPYTAAPPAPAAQPHFSPNGQQNAMLYTPSSLREVDEGFDEAYGGNGPDFALFPSAVGKGQDLQPLFGEVPSAGVGFSQTSQQDFFQPLDWNNMDLNGFQE